MNAHIHFQPAVAAAVMSGIYLLDFMVAGQIAEITVVKADYAQTKIVFHAAFFDGSGHLFPAIIHIAGRHRAVAQHLAYPQQGAVIDILPGQLVFKRKDPLVQPVGQSHIFAITPQERHGGMGMGVKEAAHQKLPFSFVNLPKILPRHFFTDISNFLAEDAHILVFPCL
ncbi:hypothetical protein SDC9_184935 [bioreactor metagenome]|uniref:Uncharacterized protein n=1 Tax=bioreactor metagenome TaxID=1076179 RepID=A0A645HEF4_9ZZZZ